MPFLFKSMACSGKTVDDYSDDEPYEYKMHKVPATEIESN